MDKKHKNVKMLKLSKNTKHKNVKMLKLSKNKFVF